MLHAYDKCVAFGQWVSAFHCKLRSPNRVAEVSVCSKCYTEVDIQPNQEKINSMLPFKLSSQYI